jgi:8-oxo-dGTP diphosphatase
MDSEMPWIRELLNAKKEYLIAKLATLCYIRDGNKTLMLHRIKKQNDIHQGKWNGLGGKFEQRESPEDCVIREVREESGLNILKPCMKGFISFPMFKDEEDWYVFIFTADNYNGCLIDSPEGELKWIEQEDLFQLKMWEGDYTFLKWIYDDKPFFSATFTYKNKLLISHEVSFY